VHLRIPDDYVGEEAQRLRVYKRIAGVLTAEDRAAVEKEMEDRYGPPPPAVLQLLDYAMLKTAATRLAIQKIERRAGAVHFKFHEGATLSPDRLMDFVARRAGAQFTPNGVLSVPVAAGMGPGILMEVQSMLESLR
jgi:transcription-repair coupling factor (superfamily II helicase)